MIFYLLSMITGVLECGWIAYGAVHGLPLWQILCFPLAYHLGNMFPKPFSLGKRALAVLSGLCCAASVAMLFPVFSGKALFGITCALLACLSAVIQSVRSDLKSDGNRLLKRLFRVGGFVVSPVAAFLPAITLVAVSVFALVAAVRHYSGEAGMTRMTLQKGFSTVMICHQLHYFFYAHITLAAMSLRLTSMLPKWGCVCAALLFCGTWITYMSVEPLVSKRTAGLLPVFLVGHVGIGLLLSCMGFVTDLPLFILMWIITGFGGGVVYTISGMAKKADSFDKTSMTIAENIGHTLGLLTAVTVATICGNTAPRVMLFFGAASALTTVARMLLIVRKGDYREAQ